MSVALEELAEPGGFRIPCVQERQQPRKNKGNWKAIFFILEVFNDLNIKKHYGQMT